MQAEPDQGPKRPAQIFMIPPPFMFALMFGLGVLIQLWAPAYRGTVFGGTFTAGEIVLGLGVFLAFSLSGTFLFRKTTLNPFGEPSKLIASGIYRLSRNPMYLSLTVSYVGGALMYGSVWPFVTLLVPLCVLQFAVIPFEEARMAATFGEEYRTYRSRVRRWI